MKKIVVISDTHGNIPAMEKLVDIFNESDYIIHLGDTSSDGMRIKKQYPDKTFIVNGNCDIYRLGEKEMVLQVEGVKLFICHGEAYNVKKGLETLAKRAKELDCRIALYGHTHTPSEDKIGNIRLFNPGTLSRYSTNTYLYLVINDNRVTGKIVELK
jgi:hypothetical protein